MLWNIFIPNEIFIFCTFVLSDMSKSIYFYTWYFWFSENIFSLILISYIDICGSVTFSGSCWVYLSYLRVGIGSFRLSCLKVLLMVSSGLFGVFIYMSGVTVLCNFRLLDLWGMSGFCPLLVCLSTCLCLLSYGIRLLLNVLNWKLVSTRGTFMSVSNLHCPHSNLIFAVILIVLEFVFICTFVQVLFIA